MSSLSKQLSSLRDDRNKNLKRFISDYKSNFKRNNIEVSKSWNSILSFDNQFDEFEILFSEIVHGSSLLSLDKDINKTDDFDIKNIIFDEHKDIDFLTSEELDHLNTIIRRFIEHSVPYFLCTECQHLIDYLIYKYNIAVSFSEYLIVAYIQYNYSEYYCKLLSLFTIRNDSNFHSFYNDMKNFSNNFSNHKYVSSNVVYSGIATNFTLYKQISSCYDRISRMCTNNYNIISFLSTVNIHFVIVNCKVMDNNEIRYVVNMLKDALCHLDSNDYICSYLCLMITVFTHIQLSVAVQREIISSLKPILYNLRDLEVLKIDHLLFFKYILMSIQLMLQYQNQTLDKLPQEITNSLIYILQKHKSTNIVFKTFNQINGFDFSRTINVTLNSLISSTLGNVDILSEFLVLQDDYNILAMENLYFFLNFVNESFNSLSMRMVLFNLIDEVNRISSHFRSHGDTIIEFDVINMLVHINNKHKFSSRLIIIYSIFKLIKKINPTLLEHTIIDYVNRLTYEMLQDQIEVIMFMYRSLSKDIVFRMFTLLNKYSESTSVNKLNDKALFNRNGSIGLILNASSCINDKNSKFYKDDKLFGSLVEFIISISTNTESHTNDLNHLLFNFIINSMNDEDLSNKLESHDRFWKSVPVKTATDSLVCYIQSLIYRLDLGFKYDSNDKLILDSIDHNALAMKDYKFIFNPYINHISKSKELFRIFKIYELILMINNESTVYNTDANINKSLSRFIMFLKTLYQNKNNDYNSENEILLEQNNNSYNEYLIDEKELIELNNDLINRLSKITSIINNDISDENDNYSHYSLYHFGYFSNSNYIILNIFSSLYLQYETLEYISKNDLCSELLHTQFVITSDLILKYVKNKAETKYIKDFVLDFYTFAILKYESIILIKSDTLNEIITIKRFETLLSNKPLNTHFINILPQLFSTTNCELNNINTQIEFINNIFDLLRINNNSNFNWSFSIGFSTDINGNIKYNINKPFNYKHKYFNVDIIKIINDNNISHILSNSSNNINSINPYNNNFIKDSPNIRTNQIISLFDTFDEDVVDKCVESVLTIFKINNNQSSSNLFLSILINAIDLLFDVTFKYSNKISIMLLELSKLCKYHVVKFSELEMTISDIENNKYGCILKLKSDINCDLNNFVNSILLKSNKPEITEHLSSIITDFLIKDNDFFNLFISILFLSSNTIFQINCYKQIFSTIFTCDHKLDFLFSLLDGMTNHMYALLSDENKDIKLFLITFVDLFTRFFLLLYFLSKFKKLINIDNLVIYAENCTHLLNMCTIFKSITRDINKNYQDSNEYNIEISEINHFVNNALIMFDNITFVLLYSLNKGWIWMLPAHYRNTLYSSFVSSFNHFNSYYNITLIKHMFDITNVDDKLFIGFIDDMLYKSYREDVFIHIINNIKSIKTHHVIIYIVKSNRNIDIGLKINLVCKIINNVLISADMENMDVQLLFNNLNNIIDVYLNIISDNKYEHIFLKTIDSNIENILKSFNMNIENEIEDNETRYNLSTNSNRIISDFNNTINNSDDSFDDDSVISFLNLIVNQVNLMLFNINRMDVNNFQVINNLYNEFYHKICQLVNTTINKYRQSYKLLKKLINNLIVTTIKMSYEQSINSYEKLSTTTVISTINNILGSNDSEVIRDLVNILIDDNESSFVDDNIYVPWMSYLIYLYFNLNKNDRYNNNEENEVDNNDIIQQILYTRHNIITSILNSSVKSISILYNIIWIHLIMVFDPVNNFGIEIDRFKGYNFNDILFNNKKLSYKINYELANEMYGFLYYYIENNNKFIINFDLDFFNNINSENRILFVELNQLLYSLLSSIVFYNHQQIEPNNNLNSNEFNRINTRTDISFINFIRSAILKIMNINKVGGYNIHIYGLLNTIFDNKLDAIFKSYELSHNIWDNVESIYINNNYYLQIVSKLMSLQNSFFSSLKLKDHTLMIKYERELENIHNISSRTLFDFFNQTEQIYLKNESIDLFNQISHMKTDVWQYFLCMPPKTVDSFLEIFENSFVLINNHYNNNGKLLWSYLDMIYSLKLIIRMCIISDNQLKSTLGDKTNNKLNKKDGINDVIKIGGIQTIKLVGEIDITDSVNRNNVSNIFDSNENTIILGSKYIIDSNKMISTIRKFIDVSENLLFENRIDVQFLNRLFILFLLIAHRYCVSILNKDFYDFSLKLIMNYDSNSNISNHFNFDKTHNDMVTKSLKEYLGLSIDVCINELTESSYKRFKYFNNEIIISNLLYYTSVKIDINTLIASLYSVCTSYNNLVKNKMNITETDVSLNSKKSNELKKTQLSKSNKRRKTNSKESANSNNITSLLDTSKDSNYENGENIIYKLCILLLSLSYNIENKKPNNKHIADLNDIYFIVIKFYSSLSHLLLFGPSEGYSFNEYNRFNFSIDDIVESPRNFTTSIFFKNTPIVSLSLFERSFIAFILKYFGLISSNNLLDLLEKQFKMTTLKVQSSSYDQINTFIESDLNNRLLLIVILSSLHEYGNLGATNLIITRLYQHIEDMCESCVSEALFNRSSDKELSFDNIWTWFNNSRFILQLIQKSIDTWNTQRGSVPDVIVNSCVKIIKNFIKIFDLLPINGEIEVDNATKSWSTSIENTLRSLINCFITHDDKIIKIESCLSDSLPTKSLNVKIGSLVIMNKLWDALGIHLSICIKNIMPIIGELVDDENEIVRRIAVKLDEKVKEVLYQN